MTFLELLAEHGIEVRHAGQHHHVTTGWVGVTCPNCHGEYTLGINIQGGYCSCWKCGAYSLVKVLWMLTGLPMGRIIRELELPERQPLKERPAYGRLKTPTGIGPLLAVHKAYLISRPGGGFRPSFLADFWGLKGIGLAVRMAWRIWVPIHLNGKIVSWTTRAASDTSSGPRWVSASPEEEAFPARSLLYGEDHVRHAVILNEGCPAVWRIGPGAVATLGMGYTRAQVVRIAKYPVRVVCFDAEAGAQERAGKLCDELAAFPGKTVRVVLDAKSADEADPKEVEKLRREFLD